MRGARFPLFGSAVVGAVTVVFTVAVTEVVLVLVLVGVVARGVEADAPPLAREGGQGQQLDRSPA